MADIILYNDQDQEQTLAGVEKLICRTPSGEQEFSVGGGGTDEKGDILVSITKTPEISGSLSPAIAKKYTSSPAKGWLTVDIPANIEILSVDPSGEMNYTITNADTGDVSGEVAISDYIFTATALDENTTRLRCDFSIEWEGGTAYSLKTLGTSLYIRGFYSGVSIYKQDEEIVFEGVHSGQFLLDTWNAKDYGFISVYDFRKTSSGNMVINNTFSGLPNLKKVYFPPGTVNLYQALWQFVGCPNLELLDYSLSSEVQSCPPNISAYPGDYPKLKVYVPSSLYSQWVADTSWSKLADKIVAV